MGSGVAELRSEGVGAGRRWPYGARRAAPRERKHLLFLIGGCALVALGAAVIAAHVTVWALDETVIEQSAVHYTSGLPGSLIHDADARATSRLYPLVLSVAFHFMNGAQAIRADHVLSVLLFVSAAAPIYLLARVLLRSRWAAAAAALLSVAVPWLTLTSALFEENLAYPLFWWAMLACCHAIWRPSLRADALALASIGVLTATRVEFAAVFIGYLLAAVAVCVWRADRAAGVRGRLMGAVRRGVRGHGLTLAIALAAFAVLAYFRLSPYWHYHVQRLFGSYANVIVRQALPANMAEALLVELIALALGVGLLPAIVSIPWYLRRLTRLRLERTDVYLLGAGVIALVLVLATVYAQNGYLGALTEERYFFYVAPLFWLGALAAIESRGVRAGDVLACGAALAALYGVIQFLAPLNSQTAFLAPVESVVSYVLGWRPSQPETSGLTVPDQLALAAALAAIATAVVWRRWPRARLPWVVGAASAVQLLIAGYAFAVVDGRVPGIGGRTGGSLAALGWVDSHARGGNIAWLDNGPQEPAPGGGPPLSVERMRTTLFWNSHLRSWAALPQLGLGPPEWPMATLRHTEALAVAPATGLLSPPSAAAGLREVVGASSSPFLQLQGTVRARSPDGALSLTAPSRPLRASWLALGLQAEGYVPAGAPIRLLAFAPPAAGRTAETVTFTLAPPPMPAAATGVTPARARLVVRLGGQARTASFAPGSPPRRVTLLACFAPGQTVANGTLRVVRAVPDGSTELGGRVTAVAIARAAPGADAACGHG